MKARSSLAALIGLWFLIAPWVVGFSDTSGTVTTSVIIGLIQIIVSLWAFGKAGWGTWQNWIAVLTGIWFVIFPFIYSLSTGEIWTSVILGLVTIIISLSNMASKA